MTATSQAWGSGKMIKPSTVIGKFGKAEGLGGKILSSVFDMMSLRCLRGIQFEICNK